jgi:hypothetical protein
VIFLKEIGQWPIASARPARKASYHCAGDAVSTRVSGPVRARPSAFKNRNPATAPSTFSGDASDDESDSMTTNDASFASMETVIVKTNSSSLKRQGSGQLFSGGIEDGEVHGPYQRNRAAYWHSITFYSRAAPTGPQSAKDTRSRLRRWKHLEIGQPTN